MAVGVLVAWLAFWVVAGPCVWAQARSAQRPRSSEAGGSPRRSPQEQGLVDTTFDGGASMRPDTARILRDGPNGRHAGQLGLDSIQMRDTTDTEGRPRVEVAKDSTLVYDPGVFGHVHQLDTILRTHRWELDTEGWRYQSRRLDSSFANVHFMSTTRPHMATKNSLGLVYGPYESDDFFARPKMDKDLPLGAGSPMLLVPAMEMYSTLGPYARFSAISGGHSSRGVLLGDVLLTHNILPSLNMGIVFRHAEDKTDYINQRVRLNVARAFLSFAKGRFFVNVSGDVERYKLHTNGGIKSVAWHTDSVTSEAVVPVHISSGESRVRQQRVMLDASVDLLGLLHEIPDSTHVERLYREPTISLITLHSYEGQSRNYLDYKLRPESGPHHISNEYTNDSVSRRVYDGRLGVAYRHSSHASLRFPSLRIWGGYRMSRYTMGKRYMYLNPSLSQMEHSLYTGAALDYELPFGRLEADGRFYFWGAHRLDTRLNASLELYVPRWKERLGLRLDFEMVAEKPGHFAQRYYSNDRIWDVRDQVRRELYTGLSAELKAPWWGGRYGAKGRIYKHYFYFDDRATPQQCKGLTVLSAWAEEDVVFYGVCLRARAQVQHSSNDEALGLPLLNLYGELGYQYEVVRNALTLRLSVEMGATRWPTSC